MAGVIATVGPVSRGGQPAATQVEQHAAPAVVGCLGEQVDQRALERIASASVLGGDVVMTIFDAAMKEYKNDLKLAREFFEIVAAFDEVPSVSKLMHHIVQHMNLVNPDAPETIISEAKSHLVGTDPASAGFLSGEDELNVHEGALLMFLPILADTSKLEMLVGCKSVKTADPVSDFILRLKKQGRGQEAFLLEGLRDIPETSDGTDNETQQGDEEDEQDKKSDETVDCDQI